MNCSCKSFPELKTLNSSFNRSNTQKIKKLRKLKILIWYLIFRIWKEFDVACGVLESHVFPFCFLF
uniref:Uncharacterized protein n=1 Tax=Rhizophora mucronata TaxID=61149 RepID=A0A2P2PT57_RHIMU